MKSITSLLLLLLVSCNDSSSVTPSTQTSTKWNSRSDTNVQHITFDVTNGGMTYYSSTNSFSDNDVWTLPEFINIDNDSLGTIHSEDYIELQIASRTTCHYYKMTNYFQFQSCSTLNPAITWTMDAGDSYYQSDLNSNSPTLDKDKVIFVLKRHSSCTGTCVLNGHIGFSYDL